MKLSHIEGKNESHSAVSSAETTRLSGFWLLFARSAWLVLAAGLFANSLFGISTYHAQLQTVCLTDPANCAAWQLLPANVQALHQLGLSVEGYAAVILWWDVAISLLFLLVGALIFWRKSAEWYGLFVSLLLVSFGCSGLDSSLSFSPVVSLPLALFQLLFALQWPAMGMFLVTFPTGRFRPRWTWVIVLLWLLQELEFALPSPFNQADWPVWLVGVNHLVVYGGTAAVQFYRYRRLYTPLQRQQTKWLVFGVVLGGLVVALGYILGTVVPDLSAPDSPYQLLNVVFVGLEWMAIILALGVSILRYRLWDIDVIINRTLVYGSLTALLALLYFGLIFTLQSLFQGMFHQNNAVAIVISTLVIAALFQPLRHRIQQIIDHRFYRRKYDAVRTVEAFSTALRNEVDLSQLSEHLVAVVQETMQPTHVSLWMRKDRRQSKLDRE